MAVVYPERDYRGERASPAAAVRADRQGSVRTHLSRYSAARYLAETLFLIRGLLLARIIGPAAFGLWSQMKIALIFLQYGKLGSTEALLREVPRAIGRDDESGAERIRGAVFAFDLLASCLIGLALVAGAGFGGLSWSWTLLAVVFVASQLFWFAQAGLRSEKRFGQVGRMLVGLALLSTVAGIPAALFFGFPGFLVALVLAHAVALLPIVGGPWVLPRPRWDSAILREMLRIGFPIMAAAALLMLLWNVDKLAVWILLSRESLGIYALGSYLLFPTMLIPEAVSMVLYPRLMERIGKTASKAGLERYLTRPTLALSHLGCPALGLFFLGLHLPIQWLLPRYAPGIVPAQILIASMFFVVLGRMPQVMLVSLDRQRTLLVLIAVAIVVAVVTAVSLILSGWGLVGAAVGTAAGYATCAALSMVVALRTLKVRAARAARFLGQAALPYVVVAAAVALSIVILPGASDDLLSDLARTAMRCLVVLVASGVLIATANRRLALLQRER